MLNAPLNNYRLRTEVYNDPQWCVVGDTFPVGCAYSDKNVFPELFAGNPDASNPKYNTECGIYEPHCGLDKVHLSWGHDEYMAQVCLKNGSTLPAAGIAIIRYHSFYAWHTYGAYEHLMNDKVCVCVVCSLCVCLCVVYVCVCVCVLCTCLSIACYLNEHYRSFFLL